MPDRQRAGLLDLPINMTADCYVTSTVDPAVVVYGTLYPERYPVVVRPVGILAAKAPVSLKYAIKASTYTYGEQVWVDADVIEGTVKWGISDDESTATLCIQSGFQHICNIANSVMFSTENVVNVWLFFTPLEPTNSPLNITTVWTAPGFYNATVLTELVVVGVSEIAVAPHP